MKGGPPIGKGSPAWFCFDFCLELGADWLKLSGFMPGMGPGGKGGPPGPGPGPGGKMGRMGWGDLILETFCKKLVPIFNFLRG